MARPLRSQIEQGGKIYFSLARVAELSGYHRKRIRQLIAENKLPARRIGSTWFVLERDAKNFSESWGGAPFIEQSVRFVRFLQAVLPSPLFLRSALSIVIIFLPQQVNLKIRLFKPPNTRHREFSQERVERKTI